MDQQMSELRQSDMDRRNFLRTCGRFAATVPPAVTVMLSTSLESKAIALSIGHHPKKRHKRTKKHKSHGKP